MRCIPIYLSDGYFGLLPVNLLSGVCQRTRLTICQHWFWNKLSTARQQAIIWAKIDPGLCRHMASLGHNKLRLAWLRQIVFIYLQVFSLASHNNMHFTLTDCMYGRFWYVISHGWWLLGMIAKLFKSDLLKKLNWCCVACHDARCQFNIHHVEIPVSYWIIMATTGI